MSTHVRAARSTDWSLVASLLAELGRPDVRSGRDEDLARQLYEEYLKRPESAAFVAEVDGEVVGFINVETRGRLNYRTDQAWIGELIVTENQRGAGVGKALLDAAEQEARRRGCWGLALESAKWRKDAHRFYEREGWQTTSLAFTKLLDLAVSEPGRRQG